MHEASLVADLVAECERRATDSRIELVRVRTASTISEEALRQAFEMQTSGGMVDGAVLETNPIEVTLECPCGFRGVLGHDDVVAFMAVCPSCGAVSRMESTAELELVEIRTASRPN